MTKQNHIESAQCKALEKWREYQECAWPELAWLFHIPNGGNRTALQGAILKAEGVKAGVWDYHLPVSRKGSTGLWIEMKAEGREKEKNGGLTDKQEKFGNFVRSQGAKTNVCYTAQEAIDVINAYLRMPKQ